MFYAKTQANRPHTHARQGRNFLWNALFAGTFLWVILLYGGVFSPDTANAIPKTPRELAAISDKLLQTAVSYGAIPSLYRPQYVRVIDADLAMDKNDPVFIVQFPDGPRIYPQRIMVWHHVVNELFDDMAYAVTYCPITGTLAAYKADFGGINLILDAEGRLYEGNAVLIDRNSGSLWLQMLGMAFDGPLRERGLPTLPVFWTTWSAAKRVFPHAPVLAVPKEGTRAYARDPYGNYLKKGTYYDNDSLVYRIARKDKRFPIKTSMLGIERNGMLLAVDISYIKKKGVVNFFLGDEPLLAIHDRTLDVVRIYNRQVWDKASLFVYEQGQLIDIASRSVWNPATGIALRGNMEKASMKQYFGVYSMWFSWYSINPETFTIPGAGEVPAEVLKLTPLAQ